jgi:hypothetical protein
LAKVRPVIGLTGTHGKTTATSMMVHVLRAAGRDESRLLGAAVTGVGANGHWGSGSLVLEVDESYGTFSLLAPYALGRAQRGGRPSRSLRHARGARRRVRLVLMARSTGPVVAWSDDLGVRTTRHGASAGATWFLVGTSLDASWRVSDVVLTRHGSSFTLRGSTAAN